MLENIKKISNPLTIIAIFAGIAEIAGTVAIRFVNPESQYIFIWFVMVFPTLLVVLFFVTLNFNHKVLYAPSDFQDEKNFLHLSGVLLKVESDLDMIDTELEEAVSDKIVEGEPVDGSSDDALVKVKEKIGELKNIVVGAKQALPPDFNFASIYARRVILSTPGPDMEILVGQTAGFFKARFGAGTLLHFVRHEENHTLEIQFTPPLKLENIVNFIYEMNRAHLTVSLSEVYV